MSQIPEEGNIPLPLPLPPSPRVVDMEGGQSQGRLQSNFKGLSNVEHKECCWINKGVLVLILRAVALFFSFMSFILMVTLYFSHVSAFCYLVTITLFVIVYTAVMVGIIGHGLLNKQELIRPDIAVWIEFFGDQIMALLLLSSASASAGLEPYSQSGASVAMCFLAFFALEPAALISGYNFALHFSTLPSYPVCRK